MTTTEVAVAREAGPASDAFQGKLLAQELIVLPALQRHPPETTALSLAAEQSGMVALK